MTETRTEWRVTYEYASTTTLGTWRPTYWDFDQDEAAARHDAATLLAHDDGIRNVRIQSRTVTEWADVT